MIILHIERNYKKSDREASLITLGITAVSLCGSRIDEI